MQGDFSDYIIYADESGDHSLDKINSDYPIFCLALCVIKKENYINQIVPAIQKLKFDYWGHDKIILHEREIRRGENRFEFLKANQEARDRFFDCLNSIIKDSPFYIISSVIDKREVGDGYENDKNPYNIALRQCMESLMDYLMLNNQSEKTVHCIFEGRGGREDNNLKEAFRKIITNQPSTKKINFQPIKFEIEIVGKVHNSTGTQLADLIARPIGINFLKPQYHDRAYEIIQTKYYSEDGNMVFPEKNKSSITRTLTSDRKVQSIEV